MRLHVFANAASAHGNIAGFSRSLASAFRAEGHDAVLAEVGLPGQEAAIIAALADPAADAIVTFTGHGTDANPDPAANLFNQCRARLVDLYLDPLAIYLNVLDQPIRRRLIGCTSPDGLFVFGDSVRLLPHAADPALPLDWADRDIPILLAGNCPELPDAILARWAALPPANAAILNECATAILGGRTALHDTLREHLTARGFSPPRATIQALSNDIDRLVRAHIRHAAGLALADTPAVIVGAGWDWLPPGRATRLGPQPAEAVMSLMRRARVCVNLVTPYHGSHERLFRGMAAGCAVVSTPTVWVGEALPDVVMVPAERLGEVVAADWRESAEAGPAIVAAAHTWQHRAREIASWLPQ